MGKRRREWNELKFEDFKGFLEEFQKESDRAAPVLGAAYLDESLRQLIAASMVADSSEVEGLLHTGNPLGSFSPRIRAAYCMGLISEDEYDDLMRISRIRNRFAHDLQGLRFTDDWARDACGDLRCLDALSGLTGSVAGARNQFNLVVSMLSAQLKIRILQQQAKASPPVPAGFRLTETVGPPPLSPSE